jgi:hypothetical protein
VNQCTDGRHTGHRVSDALEYRRDMRGEFVVRSGFGTCAEIEHDFGHMEEDTKICRLMDRPTFGPTDRPW